MITFIILLITMQMLSAIFIYNLLKIYVDLTSEIQTLKTKCDCPVDLSDIPLPKRDDELL